MTFLITRDACQIQNECSEITEREVIQKLFAEMTVSILFTFFVRKCPLRRIFIWISKLFGLIRLTEYIMLIR